MENLINTVEAILFASGKAVLLSEIAEKLGVKEGSVKDAVQVLKERYGELGGIQVLEFNKKAQLATNPLYKEQVAAVLTPIRERELTRAVLECAAIIAYKQPITRGEIESIRGASGDYGVNALLELGLIRAVGKKDAIGHPTLFGTTDEFLKRFKLNALSDLPDYDELMKAINRSDEERGSYLYAREEWKSIDADKTSTLGEEEAAAEGGEPVETTKAEKTEGGYEIPDFLNGINESDIVKIS